MKEINVNNMVQGIKQNMSTIRYIRILFIMLALFVGTASEAWAYEKLDPVNGITVYVDKTPSNIGGTIVVSEVVDDTDTDGKKVTLTITPPTGYSISENLITAVPVKNISTTRTGTPDLMEDPLDITGEGSNKYSFVLPAAYTATYVKVAFKQGTIDENIKFIRSLSEITDPNKQYEMVADIDASGFDGFDFKDANNNPLPFSGTLDGGLFKIKKLSTPLFATINDGTVKNVILEGVNISSGDSDGDAGAICCKAEGASRIYNCGILPTSVVRNDPEDAKKITGFSGSSVSGSRYVGGLVGFLDGTARVINCFSYANITNGTNVGGIVGYNNQTTTSANGNQKTMVMNCMFYGDITGGSNKAPIYNGTEISNAGDNGVGNYNYFWGGASYVTGTNNIPDIQTYNCALLAETRFLQRFEFFRHLQNSHLQLAEWWVTGTYPKNKSKDELKEMMKWVLEPSQLDADSKCPFPILKAPGYYPSVVNIDAENAPSTTERNKGGRLGTLSVSIRMGSGGKVYGPPTGATITRSSLTLNITDKDPDHYNFNYYKVQLPYYNDVGTKNYNGYRVVTGWKIVSITGGTPGSFTEGNDATVDANGNITSAPYNFADRHCTNKDLYSVSGRVFNQGAYWDVPEGVTDIIIEPYWANAAYIADEYADVVYDAGMTTVKAVNNIGGGKRYTNGGSWVINGESQKVWKATGSAIGTGEGQINPSSDNTVNDYAIVLVGNVHQYVSTNNNNINGTKKYTVTTIDLDGDNEPDYSFMFRENNRNEIHPLKWDFLNLVGLGMAQKSTGGTGTYNLGILIPTGWFETTNTALFRVTQFEYEHSSRTSTDAIILQGGVMEQWVSYNQRDRSNNIPYIHVGSNVWFKEFHTGCHQDKKDTSGNNRFQPTKHSPISVTGGDFDEFYLTGLYVANAGMDNYADNAECYINGGRFGIVCGAAMEGIGKDNGADNTGNITWQIQNADIDEFYAGGINAAKPVQGNLTTVVEGGYIKLFCGGPKFGDMNIGKTVRTTAKDCTFDTFFGAGYGGNSYSRYAPTNINNINGDYGTNSWNKFLTDNYKRNYKDGYGVSVTYSTQYLPMSNNYQNVARLLVDYVSFSLAKTRDVTSKLKGCTINKNFYGGGNLGMVDGPVTSTLTDCTVTDSVFGAGYSGTLPKVEVRNTGNFVKAPFYNQNLGAYFDPDVLGSVKYTWEHVASVTSSNAIDTSGKKLRTDKDLTTLGTVTGQVTLNIEGTTTVGGCVYGGGAESDVQYKDDDNIKTASTRVNVNGGTISKDVYGGGMGEKTVVANDVEVNIGKAPEGNETAYTGSATINGSVYGGSAFGSVNARSTKAPDGNVTEYYPQNGKTTKVNVLKGTVNGSVFGGGLGQKAGVKTNPDSEEPAPTTDIVAKIFGDATVTIGAAATSADPTIAGSVFGGSNVNGISEKDATVTVVRGNITGTGSGATFKDGNVHGGGLGQYTLVKGDVIVNVGVETNDTPAKHYGFATIKGDVYGGSAKGNVNATPNSSDVLEPTSSTVKTDVNLYGGIVSGDVYGGGLGDDTSNPKVAANVYGAVTVSMKDGTAKNVFGCNNLYGAPQSTVAVKIEGGTITSNVYGGGNQAAYAGSPTVTMTDGQADNVFGGGLSAEVAGSVTVNIQGGTVTNDVYGGGALANTNTNIANDATIKTTVNLLGGTIVGDAYGGGLGRQADNNVTPAVTAVEAKVYGDVKIYLNGMDKSFYVAADATMKTVFDTRITKPEGASYYLVKTTGTKGAVVKRVFGANNKNGSPQKNVTVHVFGTQHKDAEDIRTKLKNANADLEKGSSQTDEEYISVLKGVLTDMITKAGILHIAVTNNEGTGYQDICNNTTSTADALKKAINDINDEINAKILDENTSADDIDALFARIYDVEAVYGGGNEAAYIPTTAYHPTNAPTGSKTQVIIEGCDETSIEAVYGGGNAASAPETNVDIVSAHEIQTVFGGGNGKDNKSDGSANPGADVGVYKVGTTETIYGTGNATTLLEGGYFHEAYGASNSKGNIKGNISINTNPAGSCNLKYDKLVGAGKNADVDKDVIMILGCNPRTKNPLIFGGADNANVNGNVELTITSGTFGKVFGGNNLGGIIKGHIKVNIEETECTPIRIDELYLGGNQAAYSRYGYYKDGDVYKPRTAAMAAITDPDATGYQAAEVGNHTAPYDEPVLNVISCTYIGKVFGGGYGERAVLYGNPTVNINMIAGRWASELGAADKLGEIVDVFGGGNAAKVEGNTTVNIGTEAKVKLTSIVDNSSTTDVDESQPTVKGANITGNVYGGGNLADVTGNTNVNICAKYNTTSEKWDGVTPGTAGVSIAGNVYGGGKGEARESGDRAFYCEEAMVGIDGTNSADNNNSSTYADYGTHVRIGNGTIGNGTTGGNVYGGGEIGRVEFHTEVVIGLGAGTGAAAKSPVINGSVFGAGKGTNTHGYSGLVRGDSRVTIQGDAKVGHSVYGGGEMASIGKYELDANGLPKTPKFGGKCTVTIQGYAEIGPDNMQMTKEGGPDDTGHVFGAGKGTLPYENVTGTPWSMELTGKVNYDEGKESDYYKFIQSLGLASNSDVTIGGNAFVKGSVYGGSENGYLQANTHVTIAGGQVGAGYDKEQNKSLPKYAETAFIDPSNSETPVTESNALATCATWTYDKVTTGKPYDKYAGTAGYDAKGGATTATDGHTYYGNVFGGGRGVVPFAAGKWHRAAGSVAGNTQVDITAGHILSSVYGGNENTDVGSYALGSDGEPTTTLSSGGTCTINITGGTVGVPRTKEQIEDNPVIGNVFGAGKGDKRVLFNTWTNVGATSVNISGDAIIYGSVFGGGEDGHVINNAVTNIGGTVTTGVVGKTSEHTYTKVVIGSTGISGADGNVFGGGRGSVTALTAGVVGGNANLTINKGIIMGNVYGGGRLASVGTNFTNPTLENGDPDPRYGELQTPDADHGNIIVTVNDGTIGSSTSTGVNGNIFGGSKGTETNWKLGIARSTTVNMTGGTAYASVYGGGELAQVVGSHTTSDQTLGTEINISGGTIGINGKGGATWGNVFGGGKGNTTQLEAGLVKTNTKVAVSETDATNHPTLIYHNIYGGGAYGSVGTYTYNKDNDGNLTEIFGYTSGGKAEIYVTGGTIGTDGKENGMIFGSSRGDIGRPGSIHDKLAWVYDTHVAIGDTTTNAGITTATPLIKGSVYGGGENGHNYRNAYVRINGGTIGINNNETITYKDDPKDADKVTYTGKDYNYPYRGNVYGGGCGTDKYYENPNDETHDGHGQLYNSKAGIVQGNAIVHISAGNIVRNVYGAGAMGSVGTMTKDNDDHLDISSGGKTTIEISGGTVGVDGTDNGNVFGAARGDEATKQTDVALVKTTDVTISGGATVVWGNVYGGGQIGCVGTFTERAADGKYIWTSDAQNLNGLTKVSITGGETKGHVFGAGKGKAVTFKCEKAMVKKTQVSVSNGKVDKNVYGGGEIGRVEEDTDVKIGVGDGTCNPTIYGSVYGAGAGLETHGYSALVRHNTTVTVDGGATIGQSVYGGGEIASVGRYGLDEHKMPEILLDGGYCYVTVKGSATIGSNTVQGNVFGACKGVVPHFDKTNADRSKRSRRMTVYSADDFPDGAKIDATTGNASSMTSTNTTWEYYDESVTPKLVWEYFQEEDGYNKYLETLALATHPEVTIDGGATVNGSVYGGGEMGLTKGSVMVNILGGTITEDVYGGGALANTNTTSAVGVLDNAGIPQKTNEQYQTTTVYPKTTVNLLGGSMRDAYGGGLGQLALAAQGTEGQTGYQAAVPAIEAKVNGNVKVNLNGLQAATDINTTILNSLTTGSKLDAVGSGYIVKSSAKGAVVNRVFGCNNLNGTPTKKVQVYVFGTQKSDKAQLNLKAEKNTNTYDVQAVYGGGNLAPYVPADALLDYEQNKATVDAARPEVYIDGCDLTSIKQVYGGGNAASVPATFVEIRRCYEIDEVFGGGNGYDDYSLVEHGETKWYKNPGANVGYYTGYYTNYATYSNYETRTSGGGSGTDSDPYLAVVNPIYDGDEIVVVNGVEKNMKETRLAAKDIQYGSGIARLEVKGGTIHTSYGGSNSKGNVRAKLSSAYSAMFDDCEMQVAQSYGGGKNAYSDAETDMVADCAKGVKEMFGGAKDADMNGDINMLITNGSSLERVFGGNNTSGAVNGSITITLQEGGCEPIKIGELYAGGFLAPYSVYGYKKTNGVYDTEEVEYIDTDGTTKTRAQRIPLESGTRLYKDPRINVISATSIGNIFGGGYQAKLVGNPHINVNMTTGFVKVTKTLKAGTTDEYIYKDAAGNEYAAEKVSEVSSDPSDLEAKSYIATTDLGTIGNIYGGGNMADIVGDTYVEIGTGTEHNDAGELVAITPARNGAKISGNVFGGGKGKADSFECAKAMVGVNNESDDPNNRDGGTHVIIGNGTVKGNVYGGGEIGRVERNTEVTIGLGDGVEGGAKTPVIEGNVFGAGSGLKTHGYSALVRGNSTVTVQGNAWVQKSIYGGGETATVGKYALNDAGLPTAPVRGGLCTVTVKGYAEVGPDGMQMKKAGGPDDTGYVFGACKGILPYEGYADSEKPQHMDGDRQSDGTWIDHPKAYKAFNELTLDNNNVLEVDNAYMTFINTLALATTTEVTIGGHAFIKGSVYGGSENGHVQGNTHVTIDGDCQIGNGDGVNRRYTADEWAYDGSSDAKSLKECASWDYGKKIGTDANGKDIMEYQPYDVYKDSDSDGTPDYASDGHTFYGNVFGGGSGYFSYHRNHPTALTALKAKDAGYADGLWHREAGSVGGNTVVDIKGGHILTSVYGGNECTDVTGTTTINMSGGTLGVPRTVAQIQAHPVTCYLFGAGKGDQRINFNTWTNVEKAIVNITGGHIFGSVFGGGEDGHVLGDVEMKISGDNTVIGTTGTSYVDGNIFGGGRGFSGDAQTAGTVGGNIKINIENGKILGSVYGGGRLASVGTLFTAPDDPNYGNFMEDADGKTYGHVTINIIGGIIGNGTGNSVIGDVSGNVFGGSMGRLTLLNGGTNPIWPKMAQVKTTEVNISGNALIKRTVYGGGELGTVRDNTHVTISGGKVNRDVYGGGYGSEDDDLHTIFNVKEPDGSNGYIDNTYAFTPMQFAGCVGKSTTVDISGGYIRKSVYGGGEMASVGIMNCLVEEVTSEPGKDKIVVGQDNGKWTIYKNMRKHWDVDKEFALSWPIEFSYVPTFDGATHINITGGRIGTTTNDDYGTDNGDVYGGGKGFAGDYNDYVFCANVGSTDVNINYTSGATTLDPANYMSSGDCIAGAVYGGGENGHVMGDTHVTLTNGLIGHGLYGGGSGKGTFSQKLLKIGATEGSTSEADYYTRDIYSITAGKVFGNTRVDMSGGYVVRNVYGGGTMGSVGKGNYAGGTDDYSTTGYGENAGGNLWTSSTDGDNAWQFLNSGICIVNITGGTVGYTGTKDGLPYGNVFGGCRGEAAPNIVETPRYLYSPEFYVGYANETRVTIGAEGSTTGPRIFGSVYGGGQDGHVRRDAKVTINSGEIGSTYAGNDLNAIEWKYAGNVFGAGSGIGKYQYDFDYDGKFESTVKYNNGRAEVDTKEEDYSTSAGSVTRSTIVEVKGGTIHRTVYGGGSLASVGAPKIGQGYDPYHPDDSEHSSEVGKQSLNKVTISGGQIGDATSIAAGYGGEVNGGSRGELTFENSLADPSSFANSVWTDVIISDNANVLGNVFGGGEAGIVKHDTKVKMQGGTVGNDLYGGGDLADVGGNTVVDMTGGTIKHDAFGGARGTADVAAEVKGNATVTLNGTKFIPAFDINGILTGGRIFGANNVNGTPKGHVKVHVLRTVDSAKDPSVALAGRTTYDVGAVYGGGNNADYKPTSTAEYAEVIIDGCEKTSIKYVFGGGNAAATPANEVMINGCYIIDNVFGGGNGTVSPANVGYDETDYKTMGTAKTNLSGGYIHNVYGGSNNQGNIFGGASVTNEKLTGDGCCDNLQVQEIYGGGKQADMFGGTEIVLGCMPDDWIGAIYAGAENANVGNDVSLTLTSGKFGRVFGGNKSGGTIDGYIEVNIEECPTCGKPGIIIGELYGGGNLAPYDVPKSYGANYQSPRVNVRSFTSIGTIYGGGLGAGAVVSGNPTVNINVGMVQGGGQNFEGIDAKSLDKQTTVKLYPHEAGKIGVIGNVFGGGNAAPVEGNTTVNIGTNEYEILAGIIPGETDVTGYYIRSGEAPNYVYTLVEPAAPATPETPAAPVIAQPNTVYCILVKGADIQGNVYGAGNNAEVTGHTNVVIGKKAE